MSDSSSSTSVGVGVSRLVAGHISGRCGWSQESEVVGLGDTNVEHWPFDTAKEEVGIVDVVVVTGLVEVRLQPLCLVLCYCILGIWSL
jgi:hypothetical protein